MPREEIQVERKAVLFMLMFFVGASLAATENVTTAQLAFFNHTVNVSNVPVTLNGSALMKFEGTPNQEITSTFTRLQTFRYPITSAVDINLSDANTVKLNYYVVNGRMLNGTASPFNGSIQLYYPFKNETSIIDYSGYGRNGTATNVNVTNGSIGTAANFPSGERFIVVPDNAAFNVTANEEFLVEALVNMSDIGASNNIIISKFASNAGILMIFQNNLFECSVGDGVRHRYRYPFTDSDWSNRQIYVACERNTTSDTINIYFDGVRVINLTDNSTDLSVAQTFWLGWDGGTTLQGTLDEFIWHDQARGSAYILARNASFNPSNWAFTSTVYQPVNSVYVCDGDNSHMIFNFTVYDEASRIKGNNTNFTSTWTVNSTRINHATFSASGLGASMAICINPLVPVTTNASIIYGNSTNPQREFYLINNFSAAVGLNVSIYNSDNDQVKLAKIFVKDDAGLEKPDVIVITQRYFLDINQWLSVAMAKTDFSGLASTKLADTRTNLPVVFYRFIIDDDGNTLKTTAATKLVSDPTDNIITLTINLIESVGKSFYIFGKTVYSCTNSTTSISCSYTDNTGSLVGMNLTVDKIDKFSQARVCSTNSTGTQDTLTCSLGANVNGTYSYRLVGNYGNNDIVVIAAGSVRYLTGTPWGASGNVIAFFVIAVLAFAGKAGGPTGMLVMTGMGLALTALLQILVIPVTVLVGAIVALGIVAYVLRD